MQNHFLVGSEHAALSNEMAQEASDLSRSSSDGDMDWWELVSLWKVSSEFLKFRDRVSFLFHNVIIELS